MAKTCVCPSPPGGSIVCSDDQLAMCGYQNGQIVSGCFDPPPDIPALPTRDQRVTALNNWVLEKLTGEARSYTQQITAEEDATLRSGEHVTASGEKLSFVLPTKIRETGQGGMTAAGAA